MGQDQIVTITPDGATVIGFDGSPAQATPFDVTWDAAAADKGGYATYMDKEIHDQPHASPPPSWAAPTPPAVSGR